MTETPPARSIIAAAWRYGVVGVAQNAVSYGASLLLLLVGLTPLQSMAIVMPLAGAVSFAMNRTWTFRSATRPATSTRRYVIALVAAYPYSLLVVESASRLGGHPFLCTLASIALTAIPLFFLNRYWVFAPDK